VVVVVVVVPIAVTIPIPIPVAVVVVVPVAVVPEVAVVAMAIIVPVVIVPGRVGGTAVSVSRGSAVEDNHHGQCGHEAQNIPHEISFSGWEHCVLEAGSRLS
jgi:hypothetical protein